MVRVCNFQNHAPHCSRKHIFDLHVDANATCSCFALTWAFQNLYSRWGFVHNYRPRPDLNTFWLHQAPTYTHHICHLRPSGSIFHIPTTLLHDFSENVLAALVGSTILDIDTKHFRSKLSLFLPRDDPDKGHFGYDFRPCRSAVQPFPFLSPQCLPSWTSKNLANMCIIATGGFLGRL